MGARTSLIRLPDETTASGSTQYKYAYRSGDPTNEKCTPLPHLKQPAPSSKDRPDKAQKRFEGNADHHDCR